jgi:hypothetical protein
MNKEAIKQIDTGYNNTLQYYNYTHNRCKNFTGNRDYDLGFCVKSKNGVMKKEVACIHMEKK